MIAFIVISLVIISVGGLVAYCSDREGSFVAGLVIAALGATLLWSVHVSYRRGQIDAINGKIQFEKHQTDDGEIVWRKKSEAR